MHRTGPHCRGVCDEYWRRKLAQKPLPHGTRGTGSRIFVARHLPTQRETRRGAMSESSPSSRAERKRRPRVLTAVTCYQSRFPPNVASSEMARRR